MGRAWVRGVGGRNILLAASGFRTWYEERVVRNTATLLLGLWTLACTVDSSESSVGGFGVPPTAGFGGEAAGIATGGSTSTPLRDEDASSPSMDASSPRTDPCGDRDCVFQPTPSDAAPPPDEPVDVVCEMAPAPVTRPECPAEEPVVSDCAQPELRCLYSAGDGGTCFSIWLCRLGLWSPVGISCEEPAPLPDAGIENDVACPAGLPVDDSPCSTEGLECSYNPCSAGPPSTISRCRCGRFETESFGCTIVD